MKTIKVLTFLTEYAIGIATQIISILSLVSRIFKILLPTGLDIYHMTFINFLKALWSIAIAYAPMSSVALFVLGLMLIADAQTRLH